MAFLRIKPKVKRKMLIFLEKLQPKMFLFENVRGLLTHDKGRTYATILDIFEQAGYTIQKDILLDCPDGPGVPYGEKKRKIRI